MFPRYIGRCLCTVGWWRTRSPATRAAAEHIHGDPLPADASRDTVALVDGAELELIRDSGHFPWLEQPEQMAAALAGAFASRR